MIPRVKSRLSRQEKEPWKSLDPLEGSIELEFLKSVYLGESIGPYRVFSPLEGIIPWDSDKRQLLESNSAFTAGHRNLSKWLETAESLWDNHGSGSMSFRDQIDYFGKLTGQYPVAPIRVVFSKAGTLPAAAIIEDSDAIIDNKLYWMGTKSKQEAHYLIAILNSETARSRAEQWQSEGQWGKRDFDKAMFNLPIPLFDTKIDLHQELAAAAMQAELVAAKIELKDGEYFTKSRQRIRAALAEDGIAAEIEKLVTKLLGG